VLKFYTDAQNNRIIYEIFIFSDVLRYDTYIFKSRNPQRIDFPKTTYQAHRYSLLNNNETKKLEIRTAKSI